MIYKPTPIVEVKTEHLEGFGVKLLLKCEYLNHPFISGNKWWKLKYNLEELERLGHTTLLTFGGAYSNHIYSTAAAANELGLKSIGIIRGELMQPLNQTLAFAESCGMKLHFVSREEYRLKTEEAFIQKLHNQFGNFYLIPEGGTNELAVKGVAGFGSSLINESDFDYLCLPVGTGGTLAGLVEGLNSSKQIIGFPVLKRGEYLEAVIKRLSTREGNWQLIPDYHFGGYANSTTELEKFKQEFENEFSLPLDLVYTAKMMFGVFDLMKKGFFKRESTILVLHTGGLQVRV